MANKNDKRIGAIMAARTPAAMKAAAKAKRDASLTQIAFNHMNVETLEERRSDRLDFHDGLGVWGIKAALEAAYEAGREAMAAEVDAQIAKNRR